MTDPRPIQQILWANGYASPARDPRSPDPTKTGVFRDHTCWRCKDGAKPCAQGNSVR